MPDTFFTVERRADGSEWFTPTDHARGPWDPDACHGGPPTGLLVRALEQVVPGDAPGPGLRRPRAHGADGRVHDRRRGHPGGRATANTSAAILDGDGKVRATAIGMHLAVAPTPPIFEGPPRQHATT